MTVSETEETRSTPSSSSSKESIGKTPLMPIQSVSDNDAASFLSATSNLAKRTSDLASSFSAKDRRRTLRDYDELKEMMDQLRKQLRDSRDLLERERHARSTAEHELQRKKQRDTEVVQQLKQLKDETINLKQELEQERSRSSRLTSERNNIRINTEATIISLETKLAQRKSQCETLEWDLQELQQKYDELRASARKQPNTDKLEDELTDAKKQLAASNEQIRQLRDQLVAVSAASGRAHDNHDDAKHLLNEIRALSELVAAKPLRTVSVGDATDSVSLQLREEVGALRTTNQFLERDLKRCELAEQTLSKELACAQDEVDNLKAELKRVKEANQTGVDEADAAHRYLSEENSKIKQQKAELRVKLVEAERELRRIKQKGEDQQVDSDTSSTKLLELRAELALRNKQVNELEKVKEKLNEEKTELETKVMQAQRKTEELARKIETLESDAKIDQTKTNLCQSDLKKQVEELTEAKQSLLVAMREMDWNCEQLEQLKKRYEVQAKDAKEEASRIGQELVIARSEGRRYQQQAEGLEAEKTRLETKNRYMQDELNATHSDYKREIELLTREVGELKAAGAGGGQRPVAVQQELKQQTQKSNSASNLLNAKLQAQINELESSKRNMDTEISSLRRQLNEARQDNENIHSDLPKLNEQLATMRANETRATEKLKEAVLKAERYKQERDEVTATVASIQQQLKQFKVAEKEIERYKKERAALQEELNNVLDDMRNLKARSYEQTHRYEEQLAQQQKLIDYLQPQIQATVGSKHGKLGVLGDKLGIRSTSPTNEQRKFTVMGSQALAAHERRKLTELELKVRTLEREKQDWEFGTLRRYAEHRGETISDFRSSSISGITEHSVIAEPQLEESPRKAELIRSPPPKRSLIMKSPVKETRFAEPMPPPKSPSQASSRASTRSTSSTVSTGTMRHNIPHKWKRTLVVRPMKCAVCLDGLSFLTYSFKCTECQAVVHRNACVDAMLNTCGLPMLYTDYYLEQQKRIQAACEGQGAQYKKQKRLSLHDTPSSEGRMAGWVKLWRDEPQFEQWRDEWACMKDQVLQFYHEDASDDQKGLQPFQSIDLSSQEWRIRFQQHADDKTKLAPADVPYLVEIKIIPDNGVPPYRLYLMAPTLQAKQRWVNALQVATTKKQFARRVESLRLTDAAYLHLAAPHNLLIHSCCILNDDVLLLGCEEGLFFTNAVRPSVPFRIAGLESVYQIEILTDVEMVVVITGKDRQIGYIHLSELKQALISQNPGVRPTLEQDVQLCHLFLRVKTDAGMSLCAADPDQINILHLNKRMQVFTLSHRVRTREPVTCMIQLDTNVLIGAEQFYVMNPDDGTLKVFLDESDESLSSAITASCRQEYPTDVVRLLDANGRYGRELLLVYQNFGVFVTVDGRRSRKGDIDWERSPLEIAYTSPYLYVMHFESVEVFNVPVYQGIDTPLLERMNLLDVASPHVCGRARHANDVLVASTQLNNTDLLLYNAVKPSGTASNPIQYVKRKLSNRSTTSTTK